MAASFMFFLVAFQSVGAMPDSSCVGDACDDAGGRNHLLQEKRGLDNEKLNLDGAFGGNQMLQISNRKRDKKQLKDEDSENNKDAKKTGSVSGKIRLFASKDGTSDDDVIGVLVKYASESAKKRVESMNRIGEPLDLARDQLEVAQITRGDLRALENDNEILYVEEEQVMKAFPLMSNPEPVLQSLGQEEAPYGISMVNPSGISAGNTSIKVCVVDTGYGNGHEDLPILSSSDGSDTTEGLALVDGHGHGTHCAGTIGAIGGNNKGVVGVLDDPSKFTFHIGKGLSDSGSGSTSSVIAAVEGCVENGAKVISMSLGGGSWSQASYDLYQRAYEDLGVLIIAAAGNSGPNAPVSYPAGYPHVMSVAAVNSDQARASFSQNDDQVEIAAPGVDVRSTIPGPSYATWSGTSMACPHVAGVAALIWSNFPECSNRQIRNVLTRTAVDRGDAGCDEDYGWGVVNAKAAYDFLSDNGCEGAYIDTPLTSTVPACEMHEPVPMTPTPLPTPFQCDGQTVRLEITFDNYPSETSWKLVTGSTEISIGTGESMSSGDTHTEDICLTIAGNYTFEIKDQFGDGMCCSYGSGSYKVTVDSVVMKEGGQYGDTESVTFFYGEPPTTTAPPTSPTAPPTFSTTTPTAPPTLPPTTQVAPPTTPPTTPATTAPPTSTPSTITTFTAHGHDYEINEVAASEVARVE